MRLRATHIAPLATGILLVLSFPPFQLYLPPFFALLPLFYFLEEERSPLRANLGAFACGLVFWGGLIYWITIFTDAGFVVLILMMAANLLLFSLITRRLTRRFNIPLAASAPFVWTAIDYLHAHGDLAFTWGQPAYCLGYWPLPLQFASFSGPYGVTFWIVTINAVLYVALKRYRAGQSITRPLVALLVLFAAPLAFGLAVYNLEPSLESRAPGLRVSYVQPSMPQEIKWSADMRDSTFTILGDLSLSQSTEKPELVVWPEAAAPAYLRTDSRYRDYVGDIARRLNCHLLTGAPEYSFHEDRKTYDSFNSAFLFDPAGDIVEKYDKIHMVAISERMPWEDYFTALKNIDVGGSHFVPGKRHVVFKMGTARFGTLICFESTFPELSRKLTEGGAQFLVNITNDAWFERTSAAYQHSAFLVLRAIENRRDIVRSANTGVSAFYDRLGRRRLATHLYDRTAATSTVHLYTDRTLYCRLGDWPAHLSWIAVVAALIAGLAGGRKPRA